MCGRFTQSYTWSEIRDILDVFGPARNLQPHYNIAPTDTVDVVLDRAGERELQPMRWGLVPAWWSKPLKSMPATFNARRESISEKPMFRGAFKAGRRCIIPISGFYEWATVPDGKQPFYISGRAAPVLAVAGLHDRWRTPEGEWLHSCTMVVQTANPFMATIHDRMPVFVAPDDIGGWLTGTVGMEALRPASADLLQAWLVSRRINKTGGADDAALLEPIAPPVEGDLLTSRA